MVFADPNVRQVVAEEERSGRQEKRKSIFRSQSTPNRHSLPARPEENVMAYQQFVDSQQNSMVEEGVSSYKYVLARDRV